MSREKLDLGEAGETQVSPLELVDGRWIRATKPKGARRHRARIYYRGWDGVLRDTSATKPKVEDAIKAARDQLDAILRRDSTADVVITSSTTLARAGEIWLGQASRTDSGLSMKTISDYTESFRRNVLSEKSSVRGLTLAQINDPQRLRFFLQAVADLRGTQAAKMLRSVISRILGYAVDNGVLETNAVRQLGRIRRQTPAPPDPRDRKRAFSREELELVLTHADELAAQPTLNSRSRRKWETAADLVSYMAGTGVRIAEARATRWDHLDLETRRCTVPGTKSKSSLRTLSLPAWLVDRLKARAARFGATGLVFSSPAHLDEPDRPWDQSNCAGAVRKILDGAGMDWAVPHTFRKSVATRLHQAGFPAARISDQLGHADPGFTLRTYIGRDPEGDKSDLAAVL